MAESFRERPELQLRQGRIVLANLLMTTHLYGRHPEPELEARALSLLNDEKRKVGVS